jgi:hypothetical protein
MKVQAEQEIKENSRDSTISIGVAPLHPFGLKCRARYEAFQSVPIKSHTEGSTNVHVYARPFDIYVEFGLGARVMKQFGTMTAKAISAASPLNANYYESLGRRVPDDILDAMARERAHMRG